LDDAFDGFAFGAGEESQQWVFVEAESVEYAVQAGVGGFGHRGIVKEKGDGLTA